jgi:type I restriction enzyme, S subunit
MSDLPLGWTEASLGDSCLFITDETHHSPKNDSEGKFKYITAKNIKLDGLDFNEHHLC